ncbi:MAG TPA: hypothetical protein VLB80_04680 [Candidatus Babeliales bacterium]|nr:hypothetical protein [Candidatus Babeliales bacterium]
MKHTLSLLTILILSILSHPATGMLFERPLPLGNIEKQIFLREVSRISKKSALHAIKTTPNPTPITDGVRLGYRSYPCFTITSQFRTTQTNDQLARLVIATITQKDQKRPYMPKAIENLDQFGYCVIGANNYLDNYTQYWHETDDEGPYIKLISMFTDKQSLLTALDEYK